ncbi:N-acetyl-gamma-glutamyl-phosphate reductase [Candidatus Woesearchaeota archaeon]|nr:N-acetyl-gamma-glutamyl-phosphate reductase [Candidatus Woesearchaeota archaeon]
MTLKVSIIGASGYVGGELIRLLLQHPEVEIVQATSQRYAGKFVHKLNPNLRKRTLMKFSDNSKLESVDVMFLALPHGIGMNKIDEFMKAGSKIVDLSSDFRIKNKDEYPIWYGHEHPRPELLNKFVYGIPEIHREELKKAQYVSKAGCLAAASILGLYPLFKNKLVETENIVVEVKTGSSGGGNKPSLSTHHPERSNVIRSFRPTMHRHTAEIEQELTFGEKPKIDFSATSVDIVRGILSTAHVRLINPETAEKDIWKAYRQEYEKEPFVRMVKESDSIYPYPEPKILMGTNYCDVGFEKDSRGKRLVVISALDNLVKGSAGQAVQAFNIMCGFKEETALEFPGLHPV